LPALSLDLAEAQGRGTEKAILKTSVYTTGPGAGTPIVGRLLVELDEVDVLEVQPLGAVDGEDGDGVLRSFRGPPLLGLPRIGNAAAQGAEDGRHVAAPLFHRREELAEEA